MNDPDCTCKWEIKGPVIVEGEQTKFAATLVMDGCPVHGNSDA